MTTPLAVEEAEPDSRSFLRAGCLVMIFAMASEVLDGSGSYLTLDAERYQAAKDPLVRLPSAADGTDELASLLRTCFDLIDSGANSWDGSEEIAEVNNGLSWVRSTTGH